MNEQELLDLGYRKYRGEAVDVFFKLELCTHSAICVRGNRRVFNIRKKPWIFPDGEHHKEKLMELIDACPSGALKYIQRNEGGPYMRLKHDEHRLYLMNDEDIEAGEMIFEMVGEDVILVKHTYVHDGFNGQGVGKKLLKAMVEKARTENLKIRPVCEFAKANLEKHEEYHDVLEPQS
jgi:uncharacterized Fe-S cluster protein YjdI/predicted GNAT family acetyltransferase